MYPVILHLTGKFCVVVGGGTVAARKVRGLLNAGAQVTVISRNFSEAIPLGVLLIESDYHSDFLRHTSPFLVFAATDNPSLNAQIAADARELGALVNVADGEAPSDFDNMMTVERDPIKVAISTGGNSPALGKHLRDDIEALIGDAYPLMATWLGELRPIVKTKLATQPERQLFWERIIASDVLMLLQQGQQSEARQYILSFVVDYLGEIGWQPTIPKTSELR